MKKILIGVFTFGFIFSISLNAQNYGNPVKQVLVNRIQLMPDIPHPYKMLNWKKRALAFDSYVFSEKTRVNGSPLIWFDDSHRNVSQKTFGLYTAVGDVRQGPHHNNGEFHESLNSLSALIGATLCGVNKSCQNGYNYVKMEQNYFNSDNGWNIVMNNTNAGSGKNGGGYGRDWWYDVFPNVLYYALCDLYPKIPGNDHILRSVADQFCKADSILDGNYDYSYFDYSKMKGGRNAIPFEQDAAGGHAWVLYAAYKRFGDKRYLIHAESALNALLSQKESPFYEILLPMGAIVAARMNAELGKSYDVGKILDWTFDGCKKKNGRTGWGVIVGRWGKYDVSGLQGSTTDGGGYVFLMNSIKLSWPLVPMVKYEPQYARSIGKWMLNMANACRLFFPDQIDAGHQELPELKDLTHGIIAYEGLRKQDDYGKASLKGASPVALGDGPKWTKNNPPCTMFSLYSTAPVGILGAIVHTTSVKAILRLDCNATDFYAARPYPVYLLYNPYKTEKKVIYHATHSVDLFDIVSKTYLAKNKSGYFEIMLPADNSVVVDELPAGTLIKKQDSHLVTESGSILTYR